jgi:hypothetical protein
VNRFTRITASACFLLAVAPAGAAEADAERLDAARARWAAAAVSNYVYFYQKHCVCYSGEPPEIVVTVTAGRVSQAFSRDEYSDREVPAGDDRLDLYYTVEDLFAKVAAAYARAARVEVEYDTAFGHPVRVFIDDFADFTGEETDLRLTGFEPR